MSTALLFISANIIVTTILTTCSKTLNLIYYISQDHQCFEELNHLLVNSDIKRKIAKIHKLLASINNNNEVILMAINDLHEPIIELNKLLEQCFIIKNEHQSKYLSKWRSITLPCKELETQIQLFNTRFDDLVKITTIIHHIK